MASLSAFIRGNSARILEEWEAFARTLPLGAAMNVVMLRDHAQAMLDVIASDLEQPQTALQQSDKSKGREDAGQRAAATAASQHGSGRAESGFTVVEMVAEFRALRATVVRLWTDELRTLGPSELSDLIRFNEAMDQAIAESLARYSAEIDHTRERFLAILGHDLRNPLGAIVMSASFLSERGGMADDAARLVHTISSAARRMSRLVSDLLELAASRMGDNPLASRTMFDFGSLIHDVAAEVGASYPDARIETLLVGNLQGQWDRGPMAQALTNLVANAVQHGDSDQPIRVDARAEDEGVIVSVHNEGPAISPERLAGIFQGMKGRSGETRDRRHLGLGLYIAERIIAAHGGVIDVTSTEDLGTTFCVTLPKQASSAAAARNA